jgi:general secretion pathway protein D
MKLSRIILIALALALSASIAAQAQFGRRGGGSGGFGQASGFGQPAFGQPAFGQPAPGIGAPGAQSNAKPAWSSFKLNPNIRVTLDFRNASVDAVLHYFSQQSGIAIIKDPSLTGGITLESPKPQTLNDAFTMLNVVLGLKNFELTKDDNFLLVTPKQTRGGAAMAGMMANFGNMGGGRSNTELDVYVLHYASATTLATVINQVFAQTATAGAVTGPGGGFGGPGGGFGGPGGGFGRGGNAGSGSNSGPTVHASADDYSNSLIVNAPSAQQDQIASIIDQIDKPTDQPETSKVFTLKYALATTLQSEIQTILSGTVPLGRAATATTTASSRNGNGGGFFARLFGGGSSNNNNGTVTADSRTNSIIVTTTSVNMDQISQVIQQLDQPATFESTTFVYVMKNARADVVANLLNESFGNRTTNGPQGGSLTNPTFTSSNIGSTSSSGGSTPGGSSGSSSRIGGTNNNNFTVTSSSNNQNQTGDTQGVDEDGHIVNIRNLTGSVLLVPNIDTNSIIVVCPPEDRSIVKGILDQMDQIPEQVMIQTLVVEASLTKADSLGVEYNFTLKNPTGHGNFTGSQNYGTVSTSSTTSAQNTALGLPAGGQFTLSAGQYSATVSAIQQDAAFNVLSTPRIFTTNNATAQINISQSIPYLTNSTVDTTTGAETNTYNFLDVGIVLTVTPRITANGYVTMDVTQTANDLVGYSSAGEPIVNQRETQTTVSVQDSNTVVLGGIIQNEISDTTNKVPLLGDIPLLGNLFKSESKQHEKTELLVFLTPHVITNPSQAEDLRVATTKNDLDSATKKMLPSALADSPK